MLVSLDKFNSQNCERFVIAGISEVIVLTGEIYENTFFRIFYLFWFYNFVALVSVSEEVRSRCHIKHSLSRFTTDSISQENFLSDNLGQQAQGQISNSVPMQQSIPPTSLPMTGANSVCSGSSISTNRRQKSWDLLDQSAIAQARQHKQTTPQQVSWHFYWIFLNVCISHRISLFNLSPLI